MSSAPADRPAAAAAALTAVPETQWPESTPSEDEQHIVSVVCGNSHLHWAFHNGVQDNLAPSLFWRTPHLIEEDLEGYAAESLSRHLPQFAHEYIFGDVQESTEEDAIKKSKERKVELLSVYLISTNSDQVALLSRMWKSVPCRIYCLKGDDFFTKEQGRYDGMGVDRLATLLGAADIHGYPALVFDGGTATTYTAADSAGRIMGGGIGPGLQVRLKSLSEYTDALPHIEPDEVIKRAQAAVDNKSPLPLFAKNTNEAIVVEVLSEIALSGRNIIKKWLTMFPSSTKFDSGLTENKERAVVVTGGDGEILAQLFQNDHGGIIEADRSSKNPLPSYEIMHAKHLVHYGIQAALMKQVRVCRKEKILSDRDKLDSLIGKRVAKRFPTADADGDFIYRGRISAIDEEKGDKPGDENVVFTIIYDDDDTEDVDYDELQDLLKLYLEKGEKNNKKPQAKKTKKVGKPSEKADSPSSQRRGKKRDAPESEELKPFLPVPKSKRAKKLVIGDPKQYIGTRIGKYFEADLFFGTIDKHRFDDEDLWHVTYDDGDEEEMDVKELKKSLKIYAKKHDDDENPVAKKNRLVYADSEVEPAASGGDGAKTDEAKELKDEEMEGVNASVSKDAAGASEIHASEPSEPTGAPRKSEKQSPDESEKKEEKVEPSADEKANGETQPKVMDKESQPEEKEGERGVSGGGSSNQEIAEEVGKVAPAETHAAAAENGGGVLGDASNGGQS